MPKLALAYHLGRDFAIICADDPASTEPDEVMWFDDCARAARALRFIELGEVEKAEDLAYMDSDGREAVRDYEEIREADGEIIGTLDGYSRDEPYVVVCPWGDHTSEEMGMFGMHYLVAVVGL